MEILIIERTSCCLCSSDGWNFTWQQDVCVCSILSDTFWTRTSHQDVWSSVARGRLSVSSSLCSLSLPSLNIVFHLVFIPFVSFTDDSFPTTNRSISQMVWTRTTIFHHTDSLCVCEVWGFVLVLVEVQDIVLWVSVFVECVTVCWCVWAFGSLRFWLYQHCLGFWYSCCLSIWLLQSQTLLS